MVLGDARRAFRGIYERLFVVPKRENDEANDAAPQQQRQSSAFLHLPRDVVFLVADHLPTESRLILAQTCRDLRACLRPRSQDQGSKLLSYGQYLDYLTATVRDLPDQWVCDKCNRLHDICVKDTPVQPFLYDSCPHCDFRGGMATQPCGGFLLYNRHVQLTLKYARMRDGLGERHQSYLRKLLAPNREVFRGPPVTYSCRVCPKVVQGRYLTHTVFQFDRVQMPIENDRCVPNVTVCRHQDFGAITIGSYRKYPADLKPEETLMRTINDAFAAASDANNRGLGSREGCITMEGSCPLCPTDFSVEVSMPEKFVVRAWQDFGQEESPLAATWRSHVVERQPRDFYADSLVHEPGIVRRLYGEA